VHYDVDYRNRAYFGQVVRIELSVLRVGEKSVRYRFAVQVDDVLVADGHLVVVMASKQSPGAAVLPPTVREALSAGGPQRPETIE
jgi:acyl-CoA thioesterase FadM